MFAFYGGTGVIRHTCFFPLNMMSCKERRMKERERERECVKVIWMFFKFCDGDHEQVA